MVKKTLSDILSGKSPGECIVRYSSQWYQALFAPCVRAHIIKASDLIGYRNDRVFIRNSRHSPPPKELASGGYPWTIIELRRRAAYINALETAHVEGNIKPFIRFIIKEMEATLKYLEQR